MSERISLLDEGNVKRLEALLEMRMPYSLKHLKQDLARQLPDASVNGDPYKELTIVHPTSKTPDGRLDFYRGNVIRYDVRVNEEKRAVVLAVEPAGVTINSNCTTRELEALREELTIINSVNSRVDETLKYFASVNGFWYDSPFNRKPPQNSIPKSQ